jgi:hypothetical protein
MSLFPVNQPRLQAEVIYGVRHWRNAQATRTAPRSFAANLSTSSDGSRLLAGEAAQVMQRYQLAPVHWGHDSDLFGES